MSLIWKFQKAVNTPVYSIADLSPSSLRLIFRNRASDEMRLVFDARRLIPDNTFEPWTGGILKVTDGSGTTTTLFEGWCDRVIHRRSGTSRQVEFVYLGGWAHLRRDMYYQTWPAGYISSGNVFGKPYYYHYKTRVILGRTPQIYIDSGSHSSTWLTFKYQIGDILKQCTGLSADIGVPNGNPFYSPHISLSDDYVPLSERLNITREEAMNAVLSYFPDAAAWYDHSAGVFRVLGHEYLHDGTHAVSIPLSSVEDLQIERNTDAEIKSVKLYFEKLASSGNNKYYSDTVLSYPSDSEDVDLNTAQLPGRRDSVVQTFGMISDTSPNRIPPNLAQQIYESACGPFYEGSVTLVGDTPPGIGTYGPGKVLNLTGHEGTWANMSMPIQSAEFDVGAGKTTIHFGPPSHLEPQDLISRARALRNHDGAPSLSKMITSAVPT